MRAPVHSRVCEIFQWPSLAPAIGLQNPLKWLHDRQDDEGVADARVVDRKAGERRDTGRVHRGAGVHKDILAQGELLSTKLFSVYLEEQKIDHVLLPALEFMTIDQYDEPQIGTIKVKLKQLLQQHKGKKLFVTQGYICRNARGDVDNLKRGGSDYSASLISAAVGASVCEIWTDIDGMHNNDPRVVNKTVAIEQLSFDEAAELATAQGNLTSHGVAQLLDLRLALVDAGAQVLGDRVLVELVAAVDEVTRWSRRLEKDFSRAGVRLVAVRGRAVFPEN